MKFKYEGEEYDVRFKHEYVRSSMTAIPVRQTRCTISVIDPNKEAPEKYSLITVGVATQNVRDQFCKRTGRKLALRRAIKKWSWGPKKNRYSAESGMDFRNLIWEAYFRECDLKTLPVNKKLYNEKRYKVKALKEAASV